MAQRMSDRERERMCQAEEHQAVADQAMKLERLVDRQQPTEPLARSHVRRRRITGIRISAPFQDRQAPAA